MLLLLLLSSLIVENNFSFVDYTVHEKPEDDETNTVCRIFIPHFPISCECLSMFVNIYQYVRNFVAGIVACACLIRLNCVPRTRLLPSSCSIFTLIYSRSVSVCFYLSLSVSLSLCLSVTLCLSLSPCLSLSLLHLTSHVHTLSLVQQWVRGYGRQATVGYADRHPPCLSVRKTQRRLCVHG